MATIAAYPTEQELRRRNAQLLADHAAMLVAHPDRLSEIPGGAVLEFLPEDDPFLAGYNFARARQWADRGSSVYLVSIGKDGAYSAPVPLDGVAQIATNGTTTATASAPTEVDDEENYEPLEHEAELDWIEDHQEEVAAHAGEWLALADGHLVAAAATLKEARALSTERGYPNPLFFAVPPPDAPYR
jgi:hypothetical protein